MKTLIIYKSTHHGNTAKIARVIGNILEGELCDLKDVDTVIKGEYDLIGFGSGIYYSKPHEDLIKFIKKLDNVEKKKAFVFSTSGRGKSEYNQFLIDELSLKGFEIIGEFHCKGFDTMGPLKLIGGISKGKPDEDDLRNAAEFAKSLIKKI